MLDSGLSKLYTFSCEIGLEKQGILFKFYIFTLFGLLFSRAFLSMY